MCNIGYNLLGYWIKFTDRKKKRSADGSCVNNLNQLIRGGQEPFLIRLLDTILVVLTNARRTFPNEKTIDVCGIPAGCEKRFQMYTLS